MRYIAIFFIVTMSLNFETKTSYSEEQNYCLRENGLTYPLLDNESKCKKSELSLNTREFRHIKSVDRNKRAESLVIFKKAEAKIAIQKEKEEQEKIQKKLNFALLEKKYKSSCSKKLFQGYEVGTTSYNQCIINKSREDDAIKLAEKKRNQLIKERKEKWNKILAERKLERQRLITKREEERKKRLEAIKIRRESLAKKNIKSEKKIISQVTEERETSWFKKRNVDSKKIAKDVNDNSNIKKNNEFKIFLAKRDVVNIEKFPNISDSSQLVNTENLDQKLLKNLIDNNSNFFLVVPKDFNVFSDVETQDQMMSQLVAGTQQVPNPRYNAIQIEIRNAERTYLIAQAQFERSTSAALNYNPYGGWASTLNQLAGNIGQAKAGREMKEARNKYNNLVSELSNTPMYLDKDIMRSYKYTVNNISSKKQSIYDVIIINNENINYKELIITETKKFKVAENINSNDKNYKNLLAKYNNKQDISDWENKKLNKINYSQILNDINQIQKIEKIDDINKLYSTLNFEIVEKNKPKKSKSFFSSLFNWGSKENNEEKNLKQNNSSVDQRFDSVVVVKTSKGFGSGFYIESNKVVTNYHVIEGFKNVTVSDSKGKDTSARVLKIDKKRDLALLEVNRSGNPVQLSNDPIYSGMKVQALGHPNGLSYSMTQGIVSSVRKYSSTYDITGNANILFVQTDAAINKGNSGGPLFHDNKVIGVNTQGMSKARTEGLNFAVHVDELKRFLKN